MFAVIDIETTGGSASRDKITEIAIVVHDGVRRVREFSTLVNPERPIPNYITDITGISDEMVAGAPKFYEVAREVVEMTEDCIFVAHNVNFDYGFIREEFRRLGFTYEREKLCTVRSSRKLIPGLPSYSLGKLCYSLGIQIRDRHRAMGDTEATVTLLERLLSLDPDLGKISSTNGSARKSRAPKDPFSDLPRHLDRDNLDALPAEPGVFFYLDAAGNALFADSTSNIRRDALKKLRLMAPGSLKEQGTLLGQGDVCEISWECTGNDLVAQLCFRHALNSKTVPFASRPSKTKYRVGVFPYEDGRNFLRLHIIKLNPASKVIAEFPTEDDARAALEARKLKHELCGTIMGLETQSGPCSGFETGKCRGACMGLESPEDHNQRLEDAVRGLGFPYPRFFLLGEGRNEDEVSVVCMDDGTCRGYGFLEAESGWSNPDAVIELLRPLPDQPDLAHIVRKYLPKMKRQQIIPY